MKMKFNWQPKTITPAKEKEISKLSTSADPSKRLFSDYYPLMRQLIIRDYFTGCRDFVNDAPEYTEQREELDELLNQLRESYLKDLELWLDMHMSMTNIFSPFKFKIMPE